VIFLISGLIRLVAAAFLLRKFAEVRPVEPIGHRELIFRISQIKPIAGGNLRPVHRPVSGSEKRQEWK